MPLKKYIPMREVQNRKEFEMASTQQLEKLKKQIQDDVDARRSELIELSLKIHANPELAWEEIKASGWLTEYLEKSSFIVGRGICDLPTAFMARYGQGKPVLAIMAEYDALPDIGHGCGHNIIGTSAVGAAVAAKIAVEQSGGTIIVMGTPAEEQLGGKVIMAEKGAFSGIDTAMMVHPRGQGNPVGARMLAAVPLEVEFWGRTSHAAAAPWDSINALEALILAINNINALRFHMRDISRVAGVITDGGKVPNVVPDHSAGSFMVRATDDKSLDELCEKILNCFKAAALSTGARLDYRWGLKCSAMRNNLALAQLWTNNMQTLGRQVDEIIDIPASTDTGNVSHLVPSIEPWIAISSEPIGLHTPEFAAAASGDAANEALIDGAKALAMTAADILTQPDTLSRIKEEFQRWGY